MRAVHRAKPYIRHSLSGPLSSINSGILLSSRYFCWIPFLKPYCKNPHKDGQYRIDKSHKTANRGSHQEPCKNRGSQIQDPPKHSQNTVCFEKKCVVQSVLTAVIVHGVIGRKRYFSKTRYGPHKTKEEIR